MDVRCDRCQTEYELDDSSLDQDGVTVRCTNCGNTFLVTPAGQAPPPSPSTSWGAPESTAASPPSTAEWTLKTEDGSIHRFRELSKLHQWIVERRVTRQDLLSRAGEPFRPLGALPDLKPFFDVVDQADLARRTAPAHQSGKRVSRVGVRVSDDFGVDEATPVFDPPPELRVPPDDDVSDEIPRSVPGGKRMVLALLGGLLVAAGGGAALWAINGRRPAQTESAPAPQPQAAPVPNQQPTASTPAADSAAGQPRPEAPPSAPPVPAVPTSGAPAAASPAVGAASGAAQSAAADASTDAKRSYDKLVQEADRLLENGKTGKAQKLYEQALKLKPEGVEALTGIAYGQLDQQRAGEAVSAFKRALAVSSSHGPAVFGLAEAYRAAGQKSQALESYRKYLVVAPSGHDAPAARASIRDLDSAPAPAASPAPTVHEPPRAAPSSEHTGGSSSDKPGEPSAPAAE